MWAKLKGWRTMVVNGIIVVASSLTFIAQAMGADLNHLLHDDPQWIATAALVIAGANLVLRWRTTGPIGNA